MMSVVHLPSLLGEADRQPAARRALFALLNLGMIESLARGLMQPDDAVQVFYHAENCAFVRRQLGEAVADRLMSHGVQLPDLLEACTPEEARLELQQELEVMRGLCFQLLADRPVAA